MIDKYANYFCQKLFATSSADQRIMILTSILGSFIKICCDKKGTHTIQTMFDIINKPEEIALITKAMRGKVKDLSKDSFGHHVVSKVLATFKKDNARDFIFEEACAEFMTLAKNSNGLCVIKELIHTFVPTRKGLEQREAFGTRIFNRILDNYLDLI